MFEAWQPMLLSSLLQLSSVPFETGFKTRKKKKIFFPHLSKFFQYIHVVNKCFKEQKLLNSNKVSYTCLTTFYFTPEKCIYLLGCSVFYKIGYFLSWSKRYPHFLQVINCTHQLKNKTTNIHKVHLITFLVTCITSYWQMK